METPSWLEDVSSLSGPHFFDLVEVQLRWECWRRCWNMLEPAKTCCHGLHKDLIPSSKPGKFCMDSMETYRNQSKVPSFTMSFMKTYPNLTFPHDEMQRPDRIDQDVGPSKWSFQNPIWRFPKIGVPPNHHKSSMCRWDCPYKPPILGMPLWKSSLSLAL